MNKSSPWSQFSRAGWLLPALLLALPIVAQAQFTFTTNNGAITITGYTGPGGNVIIPSATNGFPVITIGNWAFEVCYSLTNVTIPDSVTSIGKCAFLDCTNLTRVTIGSSVSSIGDMTFYGCASLTSVTIGNSVTNIGAGAFYDCSSLTNMTIGNSVTNLVANTFDGCKNLTSITVDTNNPSYSSVAGVLFNRNQTVIIAYPEGLKGGYTIPDSVTSIWDSAFYACSSLASVTIPNSVTSIGGDAFADCAKLTSVTIGNSVTNIEAGAFYGCNSLTNATIPDSVTSIGSDAFADCAKLTNVTIGNSVTDIGNGAFGWCSSLTSVTIGNSVTNIEAGAFYDCSSLTSVTIPNSVTSIGDSGFFGCESLTNVFIPANVTNIGVAAFTGCTGLDGFRIDVLNPAYSGIDGVLFDKHQSMLIEYPAGMTGSYTVPDSVINIGSDAFCFCTGLTSVIMGTNVTSIGDSAFCACVNLATINIPIGVTGIANYAFYDCPSLTRITIPSGMTSIAYSAFAFTGLTNVTIPASVTNISVAPPAYGPQQGAFYGCSNLKGVFFQGNAPSGGDSYSFSGTQAIAYYQPGTTGWPAFSAMTGVPTVLWNPQVQTGGTRFGVHGNGFGFNITGTINIPIALEAGANLAGGIWTPLLTGTLTNGSIYFSDPQWTNYSARYYRLRSP